MAHIPIVPKIEPTRYQWQEKFLGHHERPLLGRENHWFHVPPAARKIFLGIQATLVPPIISRDVIQSAQRAWLGLRFKHPEVALSTAPGDDGKGCMVCSIPLDNEEAYEWLRRTLSTRFGEEAYDFSHAISPAVQEGEYQEKEANGMTTLLVIAQCSGLETPVDKISLLFSVDHTYTDGIGLRILANAFLRIFARDLSADSKDPSPPWHLASRNLSPPWTELMNANQQTSGEPFSQNIKNDIKALIHHSEHSTSGFKVLPNEANHFIPAYFPRSFSKKESTALLKAIKQTLGPSFTITHLAHAAFATALHKANPPAPQPGGPSFLSPCFINARRYLDSFHPQSTNHTPLCQATAPITITIPSPHPQEDSRTTLLRTCHSTYTSYQSLQTRPSLLSESLAKAETVPKLLPKSKDPQLVDPYFLSDGVQETYIKRTYSSREADDGGSDGEVTVEVGDVNFYANPDGKVMLVRMSTFWDIISVQAEWNRACYSEGVAEGFVEEMMGLMRRVF
ncbi:MAG: hypothetical protein Q9225_005345 [Loekoesia sp. 1 TL-2023]